MLKDGVEYLPLREAAKHLGVNPETLRTRKRRGLIKATQSSTGQWLYAVSQPTSKVTPDEWDALRELITSTSPEVAQPIHDAGKTYRVLSLFDVHVPEADAFALKAVLDFAKDAQPDHIVIGGDFLELESCSQHGGVANPRALADELKAGRKALDRIKNACPGASLTYLEGNHETRLGRIVAANLPTFDGALSLPELLGLDSLGCNWVPYRQLWRPILPGGQPAKLTYTHGEWTSLHHAAKHLHAYGLSVRYGHTHKPQTHTRGYGDGRICVALGTGCLRTLDPSWSGPNHGWLHGFGWDEFLPSGDFTAHNIILTNRAFSWHGKAYGVVK